VNNSESYDIIVYLITCKKWVQPNNVSSDNLNDINTKDKSSAYNNYSDYDEEVLSRCISDNYLKEIRSSGFENPLNHSAINPELEMSTVANTVNSLQSIS
jgi:hypothetical protein